MFIEEIKARYTRIVPTAYQGNRPSLRFDLLGCNGKDINYLKTNKLNHCFLRDIFDTNHSFVQRLVLQTLLCPEDFSSGQIQ